MSSQNWAASSKVRKNIDMTSKERGFWPKEEEKINFLFRSSFRALSEKNADLKKGGALFCECISLGTTCEIVFHN